MQQEIKQRINKNAFEEILRQRNLSQVELAEKIGAVHKSFNRWINEGYVQSQYVWDLTEALNLSEEEIDKVLLAPRVQVFFRKKFLGEVPQEILDRAIELANTLFGLTYLNANAKFCPPNLSKFDSSEEVANQIRRYLEISNFNNLQGIVNLLAERGVETAVVPFDKLGLCSEEKYESAFSVTDGNRYVIFLDANSPEEGLMFCLCHELSHIFRPDLEFSTIEERFCNGVAAELSYPKAFFETHREKFESVIARDSAPAIIHLVNMIKDTIGGEPFGICLRLKELGFFSQKNRLHSQIIRFADQSYKKRELFGHKFFQNFLLDNRKEFSAFWSRLDSEPNTLLRFFVHIKNGVTDESISARKFSELFSIDLSIADELTKKWRFDLHQSVKA